MKKTLVMIAIATLVMILSAAAAMAEEIAIPSIDATVTQAAATGPKACGTAHVRVAPDGMADVIYTMQDGEGFKLLNIDGDWAEIEVAGVYGFVYRDNVTNVGFQPKIDTSNMSVTLFSDRRANMAPGEIVNIYSKLEGMDGYCLSFQWQVNMGGGYQNIPGANNATYSFAASIETLGYDYRLVVSVE